MGFVNNDELEEHCQRILKSPRIRDRVVVLCEGDIIDAQGRTLQNYKKMEKMQDSSFYKHCTPSSMKGYFPQFFNCGDRNGVLDTFSKLLELNTAENKNSYLNSTLLFAIIDLDIQNSDIYNYDFQKTEEIYKSLYNEFHVNDTNAIKQRIWITGLIHKEAYFLLPELKQIYSDFSNEITYNNNSLNFENIYKDIATESIEDRDLIKNLPSVCHRISSINEIKCNNIEGFISSYLDEYEKTDNAEKYIFALLTLRKAKEYWEEKIIISGIETVNSRLKEQLLLKIADYYSKSTVSTKNHIPYFFKNIQDIISQ